MFRKRFIFSALILMLGLAIFSTETSAQEQSQASLSGEVVDAYSQEAISGVKIMMEGVNMETTSSADGSFSFDGIEPGSYTLKASSEGYEDWEKEISVGENGNSIKIELKPAEDD